MKKVLLLPFKLLAFFVGSWNLPPWLRLLLRSVRRHNLASGLFSVLVLTGVVAYLYYQSLPKPILVAVHTSEIEPTPNYPGAEPSALYLEFNYDFSLLKPEQPRPEGDPSVARIDLVGEEVVSGISLSPAKAGHWYWLGDRTLEFVPETDWPAGTEYEVEFDPAVFTPDTELNGEPVLVSTPEMSAEFIQMEFYQDPTEESVRRVVATIAFSHPVDKASLESHLKMTMRPSDETIDRKPTTYHFTVSYDEQNREAYIQSEPVTLPEQTNYMSLAIEPGVQSLLGGAGTRQIELEKVVVPDLFSFLTVNASADIVRNTKDEPEQIITLEFTDAITRTELLNKLAIYLLPKEHEDGNRAYWRSPREVTDAVLTRGQKLEFTLLETARDSAKQYNLKIEAPEYRQLYLKIDSGLRSVNNFVHASFYDDLLSTPNYPQEVTIAGEGSVLSNSGEHSISLITRGVPAIKYSIGRLLDGQISHLVSQTYGDINNPDFNNWNFNPENIASFDTKIVRLSPKHPKEANYAALDLSPYLAKERNRFGLFFVTATGYNQTNEQEIYNARDQRLVLITDLGLIVKDNADQSHDIYVQSIASGAPVAAAKVQLLGKNGLPVFSAQTDSSGHLHIPATDGLQDEKFPTVYLVTKEGDTSFIPFERYTRQINLSRFDIGGEHSNDYYDDSLNAYLFSDRGIYRPGEAANLGIIVKQANLANVERIPVELAIRGPRGNQVKVHRFKLPAKGFAEFQFPTSATTETGDYSAALYLVRDNRYRGRQLGYVDFSVEEFQPDTLKITSELQNVGERGWSTAAKITAQTQLQNLFGSPAQERTMLANLSVQPFNFKFAEYSSYHFTDPFFDKDREPLSIDTELPEQKTDADGLAQFELDLSRFDQGTYLLNFTAEGFDQDGGRSVFASNRALVSPLAQLVGYQADGKLDYINADSTRTVSFIAIDNTLAPIDAGDLTLTVIQQEPISTLVRQRNGTYEYQTVVRKKVINSQAFTIAKAGTELKLDTHTPGDYWLEVTDSKQQRLARVPYSVVGFANLAGTIDKSAELQLKLNKSDYKPGETIEMNIKAPYAGAGLITLESDHVISHQWFKTATESSLQSIKIPETLEGNAYVNVAFVRAPDSEEIFTSPLSYAVEPFSIDKSRRRVEIELTHDKIVRPGKPMAIHYQTNQPARIALFAVDVGILQVAGVHTPDPLGHFLKKRALDVTTQQILDLILPEVSIQRRLSASGGDMMMAEALAKNLNPFARKTDAPAVYWSGIVDADSEERSVSFTVPNTFAGQLKVMAVAVADDAVGSASSTALVRGPFVISPNVLTQAAPGDQFKVTVGVANIIEGSGKDAQIEVAVSSSEHLAIVGDSRAQLTIGEGDEGSFSFMVRATDKLGAATLTLTARHGQEEATRSVSLSVRPAIPYYASFDSGFSDKHKVELPLTRQLLPELADQSVAASASPLVLVDGLTRYLEHYPHGCTEQVVSQVFPLMALLSHPGYRAQQAEVRQHFDQLITRLRERQTADGGFALWPGLTEAADYPSIYALHFLLDASEQGYPVPADILSRGQRYLSRFASEPSHSQQQARNRANAIYLLTRMGEVTTNSLVDLEETLKDQNPKAWHQDITAVYMAATYQMLQMGDEAERLVKAYRPKAPYPATDDYHSPLAIDAQYVYLLAKHFEKEAAGLDGEFIEQLTGKIFKGDYNTISSAYAILALSAYGKISGAEATDAAIRFLATNAAGEQQSLTTLPTPFSHALLGNGLKSVAVDGDSSLFYLVNQHGFDQQLPTSDLRQGLEISRQYFDDAGNEVHEFKQGRELNVKVKIRALTEQPLSNVAVIDLLPGGFEIIRSSVPRKTMGWRADYVDVREDRVVFYGSFDRTVRELTYRVKLTAAGQFVVPPAYAEAMYDRSVRAYTAAGQFTVTASQ
ncbi:alpha-2-macroglobulin [Halioxenophilus sp. WMMB6]|uniref:alpha-2-macroglobulin n=1 Tax=Halioxenophilus sp. WMMB6 TaxID=3073815 RepID=UPI00295E8D4A|nr:alpha-2-macroglobulin [Halioxenophilus sp. WMMB6]